MYIYKFIITYISGNTRSDWLCCEQGETLADLKTRADRYVDEIEQDKAVASVKMTRRLVPGI